MTQKIQCSQVHNHFKIKAGLTAWVRNYTSYSAPSTAMEWTVYWHKATIELLQFELIVSGKDII